MDPVVITFKKFNFWNGVKFEISVNVPMFCCSSNITQIRKLLKQIRESDTPEVEHKFIDIMRAVTVSDFDLDLLIMEEDREKIKKQLEKLGGHT